MNWGMKNRLSKTIDPKTGKSVMLAVDHGYFQGPTTGLRNLKKAIEPLMPFANCLYITRGMVRNVVDPKASVPIFLRVSGGPSILQDDLSDEHITVSMKEALRLNAVGVGISIFVGGKHESRTVANLGKLVNEAEECNMPVLAITAVGKEMARDARYIGLACRMAAEQGAHIIKTYYCEEFEKVIEAVNGVPVVIAGGKKIEEKAALEMAHKAIKAGAVGVDMGRNIFQSDNPVAMMKAVRAVVHDKKSVEEAFKLYQKR
jgi:putative autoinducer-2 (AI-2) aldolase